VDLASGAGAGFRESSALAWGGWALGAGAGRWRWHLSLEAGGGVIAQGLDGGGVAWSGAAGLQASATGTLWLSRAFGLVADAALPALLVRRDARTVVLPLPSVTVGVAAGWP
jgi:hypothetical protein